MSKITDLKVQTDWGEVCITVSKEGGIILEGRGVRDVTALFRCETRDAHGNEINDETVMRSSIKPNSSLETTMWSRLIHGAWGPSECPRVSRIAGPDMDEFILTLGKEHLLMDLREIIESKKSV